jgi:choline-sulfatase
VSQNVSLVDLLPTMIDFATDGAGLPLATPIHGRSLRGLMEGRDDEWPDTVISEYTSDGSTGPSRMVRKGPWKYMEIEGVDQLLFNLEEDPDELHNRIDDPALSTLVSELKDLVACDWDIEEVRSRARANQQRRLLIHSVTGGDPTYVHKIRDDDDRRYIRNAGAADTKARARLPYVAPAQPDKPAGSV